MTQVKTTHVLHSFKQRSALFLLSLSILLLLGAVMSTAESASALPASLAVALGFETLMHITFFCLMVIGLLIRPKYNN